MGQEILYCFKCQERVTTSDLDSSNALRFGTKTACKKCVPDLLAGLSAEERKQLVARVQSPPEDARTTTGRHVLTGATPRPRAVQAVTGKPAAPVWAFAGGGAVVVIVAVIFFLNGSRATPPPRDPPRETTGTTPRPVEESPRERAAREALAKAKNLPASDLEGQIAAYAQAIQAAEGTSYLREAKERHEGIIDVQRKAYAREIAVVEERARALLSKEEFGAALAVYEAVRPLHPGAEWKSQVEAKLDQVRRTADSAYAPLKEKAALARSKGAEDDVKAVRERVVRWGLPDQTAQLEAFLGSLAPAAEERPWTPLFDGKSLDFLVGKGEKAWVVENGLLVHVKTLRSTAQTVREFSDGEFRIRFEIRQLTHLGFVVRQGTKDSVSIPWNRVELDQMGNGDHEVLIVFRGKEVFATLDGKPNPIQINGNPIKGHLQFNATGESFAIKALEFREPGLSDGLVGHWTMDSVQNGKTPDSSPNKNDGELVNTPEPVAGRIGGALQCDGRRSFISVPSTPSLTLSGPFTLTVWVNPGPWNGRSRGLVEKWDDGAPSGVNGYFLRLGVTGRPHFVVSEAGGNGEVLSQKSIPAETWTFLAGVFDGSNQTIYVNGLPDRSVPGDKPPKSSKNPVRIGTSGGGGGQPFLGAIDDVRIYSRALSPQEIARLAQGK